MLTLEKKLEGKRDGKTYDDSRDRKRLNRQALAVYDVMRDGQWRTLGQIADLADEPEASVSARLRDLRKPRFGGFTVDRMYLCDGIWQYRVLPPEPTDPVQFELLEAVG